MSRSMQIIAPDLHTLNGVSELLVSWGGQEFPSEPRRFQFGGLGMSLLPIPTYIRARLSSALTIEQSALELDEEVVNLWATGNLMSGVEKDLAGLFRRIAAMRTWAVFYESGAGTGAEIIRCSPQHLFQCVDVTVRGSARDLTSFVPLIPAAD